MAYSLSVSLTFKLHSLSDVCTMCVHLKLRSLCRCNSLHDMCQIYISKEEKTKQKKRMGYKRGSMSGINGSSLSSGCSRRLLPEIIFREGWSFNLNLAQYTNRPLQHSFHFPFVSDFLPSPLGEEMSCKGSPAELLHYSVYEPNIVLSKWEEVMVFIKKKVRGTERNKKVLMLK